MAERGIQLIEEEAALEVQHINVKLLLKDPAGIDPHALIPIFHEWIQRQDTGELLLDVASYAHVKDGPGVLLIGHEADYSLDLADSRSGLKYNRKAPLPGTTQQKLAQGVRATATALKRLEQDGRLHNRVAFDGHNIEVAINDRLLAPNTDSTRAAFDPELRAFLDRLARGSIYSIDYEPEPRRLFGARINLASTLTLDDLLDHLEG